jgi:DNA-binding NarL/FixJ family response regulator
VVDDHPLLREGIAALIGDQPDLALVGEASNGREAVERYQALRPDVTLMDLQMPQMSGIDAMLAIRSDFPAARIIVLTTYAGDVLAERALKAGAYAYLLKDMVRKELPDIIRAVHRGVRKIEPVVAMQIADHVTHSALTSREIEVLGLVASGNSNKQIARILEINQETSKSHVKSIIAKLGAQDRTHAVTLGVRRGIILL